MLCSGCMSWLSHFTSLVAIQLQARHASSAMHLLKCSLSQRESAVWLASYSALQKLQAVLFRLFQEVWRCDLTGIPMLSSA